MGTARTWSSRLCLALLSLGLSAVPSRAELPANAADLVRAGHERLDGLTAKVRAKGDLPRLLVPDEATILVPFWDMPALLGPGPYRKGDLKTLMEMLQKRLTVMQLYVAFAPTGVEKADGDRNISVFQDEIYHSMRALLQIAGAALPAVQDMIGKRKPSELNKMTIEGAREVRTGMSGLVGNGMAMMTHPGLKPENQMLIAGALADNANAFLAGSSLKERASLTETARSVLPSLHPEARSRLEAFMKVLSRPDCEVICQID